MSTDAAKQAYLAVVAQTVKAPDNDELVYLTVSLRDFADANGLLPAGFDPLVRESFGSLLPLAG